MEDFIEKMKMMLAVAADIITVIMFFVAVFAAIM